jgi:hypothetical protein
VEKGGITIKVIKIKVIRLVKVKKKCGGRWVGGRD